MKNMNYMDTIYEDRKYCKTRISFDNSNISNISGLVYIWTEENGYKEYNTTVFDETSTSDAIYFENKKEIRRRFKPGIWHSLYKRWNIHNSKNNSKDK